MARFQKTKRPKMSGKELGSSLVRMFALFKGQRKVLVLTIILSMVEAVMITFTTFCMGVIYNNFLLPGHGPDFLKLHWVQFLLVCATMMVVYIISQISFLIHSIWMAKVSEKVMYGLRRSTMNKLHLLPVKFFDIVPSGEIMTRMSSDIDNISQLTSQQLSSIFFYGALIITNTIVMFLINWYLALITMIAVPIMVIVNILIVKKVQPSFLKQQNSISKVNGFAEEKISGTKIISLFRMEDKCVAEFDVVNKELTNNSLFAQTASNMMMPINLFLTRIAIFIICALGIGLILYLGPTGEGEWLMKLSVIHVKIGDIVIDQFDKTVLLIIFTTFSRNFTESINNLISSFSFVFYAVAGAQRVFQILDSPEEKDLPDAKPLKELKGKVEAKNLSFGYEKGKLILKKLNFVAKPGQTVAIVGPTGAGKTTITNLVTKFYDPDSGKLLFDNIPVEKITRKFLRQNIAVILQDTFLFAESVKDNIRYGRLDATDKEIIAAAKEAHLHDFIMHLPNGYNTILRDNGSDLSAGQRQLLTIARAFLAKPKIVILDEATSSIDTKTELLIGKAMDKLMTGKTCFVVAHRLSTIVNADQILVLDKGQIVERGTHKELLKKHGFYFKLYDAQFKKGQQL
ncbi:MAG: ABC transporter ATP-binding protein [Mycoplasma sp.]|nr:ABC transporter ATP-binding protein [Candidatus Hennigella equi]